jgi:hypothetical protein
MIPFLKTVVFVLFLMLWQCSYSQLVYTSRTGSKFFPGHMDIAITIDSSQIRYELFHHWFSLSYAECRQLTIPITGLYAFNQSNDSIQIRIQKNKVFLTDKRYGIHKKIKHRNLCTSAETMRKISFACKLTQGRPDIHHFELYTHEDLKLTEPEFRKKVLQNFELKNQTK